MKLKIAIVVHGRFHAFDLARESIELGHEVTLLTNYPKFIAAKFGIPRRSVRSFLLHGIASRAIGSNPKWEPFLHSSFARWAGRILSQSQWDAIHCFSGVALETFIALSRQNARCLKTLVRGSSHIRTQLELLEEEEKRAGFPVHKPSRWMMAREEKEYGMADGVIVLSNFARKSFLERQFPAKKLRMLPLGSELEKFRPEKEVIETRCERILSAKPLNILMVGTFSFRKGVLDFLEIASLGASLFEFQFVGPVAAEARHLIEEGSKYIEFIPKQPQSDLPSFYARADIFIFPTIEDGYAMVLSQAQAAGLPILTTTNCSGPDIVLEDRTGWILPIRTPWAFADRLRWCDQHRQELAQMVRRVYGEFQPRDWSDVATDFAKIHQDLLGGRGHGE